MRDIRELPMADPGREKDAREWFQRDISPDEYAARHAHEWYCVSFDDYRYSDPDLERWIHRLGDILFEREGAPTVDELRRRYLTDDERRLFEQKEQEDFWAVRNISSRRRRTRTRSCMSL